MSPPWLSDTGSVRLERHGKCSSQSYTGSRHCFGRKIHSASRRLHFRCRGIKTRRYRRTCNRQYPLGWFRGIKRGQHWWNPRKNAGYFSSGWLRQPWYRRKNPCCTLCPREQGSLPRTLSGYAGCHHWICTSCLRLQWCTQHWVRSEYHSSGDRVNAGSGRCRRHRRNFTSRFLHLCIGGGFQSPSVIRWIQHWGETSSPLWGKQWLSKCFGGTRFELMRSFSWRKNRRDDRVIGSSVVYCHTGSPWV